jgi:hypothetical protein
MLTEGFQLLRHLHEIGATLPAEHSDFKDAAPSYGPLLRVRLASDGTPVDVCAVAENEVTDLWTLRDGKKNSFPIIRLGEPTWPVELESPFRNDLKEAADSSVLAAANALHAYVSSHQQSHGQDSVRELRRLAKRQVTRLEAVRNEQGLPSHVRVFAAAFRAFAWDPAAIVKLAECALTGVQTTGDKLLLEQVTTLLVGNVTKNRGARVLAEMKVQLVFDLKGETIHSPATREATARALLRVDEATANPSRSVICSLSQTLARPVSGPFPEVKLPVLNKPFPLFSKFHEAPCNDRYGRMDSDAIDIGASTANEIAAAFRYLTRETFRNKTWRPLFSGRFEASTNGKRKPAFDLLLIFVSGEAPIENIPAAASLFATEDSEFGVELRYEAATKPVCEAFRGIVQRRPDARLSLLLIRKASEGQIQVSFSEQPTVADVLKSAERWAQAANNLPAAINAPVFPKPKDGADKKSKPVACGPLALFPEDFSRLTTRQWLSSGGDARDLQAPPFAEIWDVFLERGPRTVAARAHVLERLLALNCDLLIAAWGAFRADHLEKIPNDARLHALRAVTALGTLLYLMNSNVEKYRHSAAFQIGRLLALADDLHRCYCLAVRGGQMPTTLIGNGLVGRASDSPTEALAELNDRIRIYVGWAKVASGSDAAIHAQDKVLPAFQLIAEPLAAHLSAQPLDAVGKSQLLLGYIADPLSQLKS